MIHQRPLTTRWFRFTFVTHYMRNFLAVKDTAALLLIASGHIICRITMKKAA
jgi:hypothetical protein